MNFVKDEWYISHVQVNGEVDYEGAKFTQGDEEEFVTCILRLHLAPKRDND